MFGEPMDSILTVVGGVWLLGAGSVVPLLWYQNITKGRPAAFRDAADKSAVWVNRATFGVVWVLLAVYYTVACTNGSGGGVCPQRLSVCASFCSLHWARRHGTNKNEAQTLRTVSTLVLLLVNSRALNNPRSRVEGDVSRSTFRWRIGLLAFVVMVWVLERLGVLEPVLRWLASDLGGADNAITVSSCWLL